MIFFTKNAWADYVVWQEIDKKKLKRVNDLIKECTRTPFIGIGKPEPLKGDFSGLWSRRIDEEHRFVYSYDAHTLTIYSCRHHYF